MCHFSFFSKAIKKLLVQIYKTKSFKRPFFFPSQKINIYVCCQHFLAVCFQQLLLCTVISSCLFFCHGFMILFFVSGALMPATYAGCPISAATMTVLLDETSNFDVVSCSEYVYNIFDPMHLNYHSNHLLFYFKSVPIVFFIHYKLCHF